MSSYSEKRLSSNNTVDIKAHSIKLIHNNQLTDLFDIFSTTSTIDSNYAKLNLNNTFTANNIFNTATFGDTTSFTSTLNLIGNLSVDGTTISPTELSYLDTVSSNIQTQLDGKQTTNALLTDLINEVVIDDSTTNIHDMMLFNNSGQNNHSSISIIGGPSFTGGASLYLAASQNFGDYTKGRKCRIFAEGMNFYGQMKLHFCLNSTLNYEDAGVSDSKMTILPNGNVGINKVNPAAKLEVNGTSLFKDQIKLDVTASSTLTAANYSDFAILLSQQSTPARSLGFYQNAGNLIVSSQNRIRFLTEGTLRLDLRETETRIYHNFELQANSDLVLSSTSNITANGVDISPVELSYLKGVTGGIQFQLNNPTIKTRYNSIDYPVGIIKFINTNQYLDLNDIWTIDYIGHISSFNQDSGEYIGTGKIKPSYNQDLEIFNTSNNGIKIFNNNKMYINVDTGIGVNPPTEKLDVAGNLKVSGSISKGSGSFDISHVVEEKAKKGWKLRHYFCETPSAGGNLYKYQLECVKAKKNIIELPDYFKPLNTNSLVYVNPFKHFGIGWGEVIEDKCIIEVNKTGMYNILIFSDRHDPTAMENFNKFGIEYMTNEDGTVTRLS